MKAQTDMLVRQHMAYLHAHENAKAELDKFETLYDHMYYYFHDILGMPESEAIDIVNDFYSDAMRA